MPWIATELSESRSDELGFILILTLVQAFQLRFSRAPNAEGFMEETKVVEADDQGLAWWERHVVCLASWPQKVSPRDQRLHSSTNLLKSNRKV